MAEEEAQTATDEALNNYDFSASDAGASHTIPMDAGQIRKVQLQLSELVPGSVRHLLS